MSVPVTSHDPRYLAGLVLFNRGDYFEAHEVWEDLWTEAAGPDRRFYQGLIQTAVGLCHFCNGNVRGAVKLYHSSRDYLGRLPSPYQGLDLADLGRQMERCFAPLLAGPAPPPGASPDEELLPVLTLTPAPADWPDPTAYLPAEDEDRREGSLS
jgi:hypothetical protein